MAIKRLYEQVLRYNTGDVLPVTPDMPEGTKAINVDTDERSHWNGTSWESGWGLSTYLSLSDTPPLMGTAGQIPVVNAAGIALGWGQVSDFPQTFVSLTDTSADALSLHPGQRVSVNAAGTGLEYTDPTGTGLLSTKYRFSTILTGLPAAGYCSVNNATILSVTEISLNVLNNSDVDISGTLGSIMKRDIIAFDDRNTSDTYTFRIEGPGVLAGDVYTFPVTVTSVKGVLDNNERITAELIHVGAKKIVDLLDVPDIYGTVGQSLVMNSAGTGLEWAPPVDTSSFVLKAGDTMTGPLTVDSAGGGYSIFVASTSAPTIAFKENGTNVGLITSQAAMPFRVRNGSNFELLSINDEYNAKFAGTVEGLDPTLPEHLATKAYVDDNSGEGAFLPITGGKLTGNLAISSGAGTTTLTIGGDTGSNSFILGTGSGAGGAGGWYLGRGSSDNDDFTIKNYVSNDELIMREAGGMDYSGNISASEPTADTHLATKKYVDDNSGGGGGDFLPLDGSLPMTGDLVVDDARLYVGSDPTSTTNGRLNFSWDNANRRGRIDTADQWGNMSELFIGAIKIGLGVIATKTGVNVGNLYASKIEVTGQVTAEAPTSDGHLATKKYVDDSAGSENLLSGSGHFSTASTFSMYGSWASGITMSKETIDGIPMAVFTGIPADVNVVSHQVRVTAYGNTNNYPGVAIVMKQFGGVIRVAVRNVLDNTWMTDSYLAFNITVEKINKSAT